MLDATGKIPDGILGGNLNALGSFHECIDVEVPSLNISLHDNLNTGSICDEDNCVLPAFSGRYGIVFSTVPGNNSANPIAGTKMKIGVCLPSSCSDNDIGRIVTDVLNTPKSPAYLLHPSHTKYGSQIKNYEYGTGDIIMM